ncbi:MAG: anaerobic ribonucleoside-triphosphate reductase activating protein [Acholeplasmatales bacterium]|nr:anaerobic ribonucleoside-triphosphate reductase activating protein [Acholeplasmatales bacterium]
MQIAGFDKLSLLNYPDRVAATIFTNGCNFRCPYCQNSELVLDIQDNELIPEEEVLDYLRERKKLLDGVCITGGEPTIQPDLIEFIKKVKDIGLLVKLDTNGSNPQVIKTLLDNNLIDYIAMDIKSVFSKYEIITCRNVNIDRLRESINLIKNSKIEYEFRTTVIKEFMTPEDIELIINYLNCKHYFLQKFEDRETNIISNLEAYTDQELKEIYNKLKQKYDYIQIRGIN